MGEIHAQPTERWAKPIVRLIVPGRLIADINIAWPWPYSAEAIDAIGKMVPENSRQRTREEIVRIGRRAVITRKQRRDYPKARPKPNLKAEIDRLKAAVTELNAAALSMSPAAWDLVGTKASPYGPFRSMASAMSVIFELRDDDINSDDAPGASDGRSLSDLLGRVLVDIEDVFDVAHGGKRPRRGCPDFRLACINPLGFCPDKAGFTEDDVKMMESQIRRVRKKT
jgi:hypothetical protein